MFVAFDLLKTTRLPYVEGCTGGLHGHCNDRHK